VRTRERAGIVAAVTGTPTGIIDLLACSLLSASGAAAARIAFVVAPACAVAAPSVFAAPGAAADGGASSSVVVEEDEAAGSAGASCGDPVAAVPAAAPGVPTGAAERIMGIGGIGGANPG